MITKFKIFEQNSLIDAANNSSSAVVKYILGNSDIDVNETDDKNWTALFYGAWNDNINIIKDLIKAGIDVNIKDENGFSALSIAAKFVGEDLDIVEELIAAGADLSIMSDDKKDCFEVLPIKFQELITNKYPEQYKKYLIKKDQGKYNL